MLTVSFHKYGNYFFPGTGDIKDIGESHGKYYSLNVPMRDGTDDRTFEYLFNPIMSEVMKVFQPGAVVLQCGEPPCNSPFVGLPWYSAQLPLAPHLAGTESLVASESLL